ncbi:MAG: Asp-tRNA(Asn)/Glu-tRNA(Gln) amidotransferase GatCAB subunit B, partial [Bilophila sp.]
MSDFETVIGLEVHVHLSTRTKLFCSCPTTFGVEPNTNVCEVCSGMPGVLPVLNKTAVEY